MLLSSIAQYIPNIDIHVYVYIAKAMFVYNNYKAIMYTEFNMFRAPSLILESMFTNTLYI
jgi:hypothetical protein